MSDYFRLADMALVQFYVSTDVARDVIYRLGNHGTVQLRDLNLGIAPFHRAYISDLSRVENVLSQIAFLIDTMAKYQVIADPPMPKSSVTLLTTSQLESAAELIAQAHARICHLTRSHTELTHSLRALTEQRRVFNVLSHLRTPAIPTDSGQDIERLLLGDSSFSLNNIHGAIDSTKVPLLRTVLYRALRGNLFFYEAELEKDDDDGPTRLAFLIYVQGSALGLRARKIAISLEASLYDIDNNDTLGSTYRSRDSSSTNSAFQSSSTFSAASLNNKIADLTVVAFQTHDLIVADLMLLRNSIAADAVAFRTERLICLALNKFDHDNTRQCLVGEGWIPSSHVPEVRALLRTLLSPLDGTRGSWESVQGSSAFAIEDTEANDTLLDSHGIPANSSTSHDTFVAVVNELSTNRTPPTFHRTNKFTAAFQLIVDAYGIATYHEVNPGLAAIVTFPFMFAIMFGDMGHGFIVLLIALYLIINEVDFDAIPNKDEIFDMAFSGRYIVLLMGIFSIYTGFIYNDIFSKSTTLFKSAWSWPAVTDKAQLLVATKVEGATYPFGIDWSWHGAENNLLFTNSYKMKLSILMGFIHMTYSFANSLVNYRYFHSKVDIIGNFIPGLLFMQSIFGYLSITIVYKWLVDWVKSGDQPPGLLNMLINMFLLPGTIQDQLYPGQKYLQIILVMIALACVPWLLVYKPWTLKRLNDAAIKGGYSDLYSLADQENQVLEEQDALSDNEHHFPNDIEPMHHNSASHGDDPHQFNFGDVVIHQVIHTIEFCLNCVSHTASYLRLWALSLAHAQLLTVLWLMTIQNAFGLTGTVGIIATVVLFALWFVLTVCILVLMEGTSAMLHSLRLHWVEAMSKFFEGEGYAFVPFTFDGVNAPLLT